METLYSIIPIAGRFVLATGLLMLLYWSVWRKRATYRAKRAYLITMPAVAIIIALLQVEVYKPEPVVIEITHNEMQTTSDATIPRPFYVRSNSPQQEGVNSAESLIASSEASTKHTESAEITAGSDTSLPLPEESKEWVLPLFGLGYTLFVFVLFTPFAVSLYQVHRLRKEVSVRKDDNENNIHILMGSAVKAPFSFYRTIFMPLALTEAQRRMIMQHERAHILHRHYIDVWVSETVTRLLWWTPFLWWTRAELRNVHEFEADSEVLATGEDVLAYQTILIEEVLHGDVIIANGFNHSFIRRRFVEMLQTSNRRMTIWAKAGTTAWILLTAALMCCTVGEAETVYKVKSEEPSNVKSEIVRFDNQTALEKELAKRDSLLWAYAHSIPTDFSIHTSMKSEEEQKLFERFMWNWIVIIDHNGMLERGEYPIGLDGIEVPEEEGRDALLKTKENFRERLMETLSQIDAPLRDTLNLFLEKFGLDLVLPKGKGFMVVYKQVNGEPAFWGRADEPSNAASEANNQSAKSASEAKLLHEEEVITDDEGQWFDAVSISSKEMSGVMSEMNNVMSEMGSIMSEMFGTLYGSLLDQLQSMIQKQYDSLVSQLPPDTEVASLEEINKSIKTLKDSITMVFKQTQEAKLKPGEEVEVPMIYSEEIITEVPTTVIDRTPSNNPKLPILQVWEERIEENDSDEEFISPQWGLELPEGYVRLTDYKKQAETDAQAKQQYDLLMKCINKAKALRNKALTDAYGDKHTRYVTVEEEFTGKMQKVFRDARIGMLEKGAYRLPDGTIVIEDDRLNLMPQTVNWHKGTTQRGPRLRNAAPTMERDKSPNYDAHNEQTWPVYTHVQTINWKEYDEKPKVFRGKDCTYVVEHFPIAYDFHWFYTNTQDKLVDTKTGDQYMKRYTEHFHMNNYMWIHGMKGEVIRLISVYPPLPEHVTTVDFIPSHIPDEIRLSNAAPRKEYKKLKVQDLEQMGKVVY